MIGKSIAHYRVTAKLGAGGMGVVYRATDTKLGRDVALKVLPPVFANDSERMARFKREAHVLASLNHPNIASIYGLEESDGVHCLVLELVEGPTLAERIREGAVPLEESLTVAKQIADALEAAHEKGVIHRDLKPANVKVTPEGMVKVLDFGLAKALGDPASEVVAENSPTLSVAATKAGIILGTAAYMSPEQARGQEADKRADIWAFGVVLYEMLTGKRTFEGQTVSDTLAAVIMREPNWEALPSGTPAPIQNLLHRCLEKDRKQRLQAIGEARITIDKYFADPAASSMQMTAAPATIQPLWRRALPWAMMGMLAVALAVALWPELEPTPPPPMRLSVEVAPGESLWTVQGPAAVLSPDGTRMAFVTSAEGTGQRRLYVRPLDRFEATPLPGTEGVTNPFFSPDGEWIAFFAGGKLKKISVAGGATVTLCDAEGNGRGGSWGEDGAIIFASGRAVGLSQVSSSGGTPEDVTTLDKEKDEVSHRWPQVLPGGKAVLFTVEYEGRNFEEGTVQVQSLETGERKTLQQGGMYGRYLPTGHLVYISEATMFAAPFDPGRLEVTGPQTPIVEDVRTSRGNGGAQFDFSQTGTLVYLTGAAGGESTLVWVDREGKREPLLETPHNYSWPKLSPDGRRLAVQIGGSNIDVWVHELSRNVLSRLTFAEGNDGAPVWTPDGERIAFRSSRDGGAPNIYWKPADGSGEAERLTTSDNSHSPYSWSPDGKMMAFFEQNPETGMDIWTLRLEGDRKPEPFLRTRFGELGLTFSPDGRWITYQSNESGRTEVYVRPFPGPGGKWQVSAGASRAPFQRWSHDGRELFYLNGDKMMVVPVRAGESFSAGTPQVLFEGSFGFGYDVTADGQRFVMVQLEEQAAATTQLNFVFNWFDEVRRRVAAAGQN